MPPGKVPGGRRAGECHRFGGGGGQGFEFPLGLRVFFWYQKGFYERLLFSSKGLWGYGLRGPRAEGFMGLGLWGGFEETRNAQPE